MPKYHLFEQCQIIIFELHSHGNWAQRWKKNNFIIFPNIYLCFLKTLVQYGEGLLWCMAQIKEGLDSNSE